MSWKPPRIPTCPAERLVLILLGARDVLAVRSVREHALGPLVILIAKWMSRRTARFTKLLASFREGRLRLPRARVRRSEPTSKEPQKLRVPGRRGWMIRWTQGAAVFGSQLQFWLEDPEVKALLAAAPKQAGRLLRPICHALDVPLPPELRLPKRPRRKQAKPDAGSADHVNPDAIPGSPNAAPLHKRPSKAEIRSWAPGQRRPILCRPGAPARVGPSPPLIRPRLKLA
jgi:hypothetical protein